MKQEPKYLIKFTNAHNDNGTVWYTIDVTFKLLRFSSPRRINTGHSKNDSVICVTCTSLAKRVNIRISYRCSLLASFLVALMRLSSKKGKKSWKTTIILYSKVLILMNFRICYNFSITTNPSRKYKNPTRSHHRSILKALLNLRKKINSSN